MGQMQCEIGPFVHLGHKTGKKIPSQVSAHANPSFTLAKGLCLTFSIYAITCLIILLLIILDYMVRGCMLQYYKFSIGILTYILNFVYLISALKSPICYTCSFLDWNKHTKPSRGIS